MTLIVGQKVDHHSVIGGSITSVGHFIHRLDNIGCQEVAWISGKNGSVSVDSLSPSCQAEHLCRCGMGSVSPHPVGTLGCTNLMTPPPIRAKPHPQLRCDMWEINNPQGVHEITDYTLVYQRGYYMHPCGCWQRFSESTNSLPDET